MTSPTVANARADLALHVNTLAAIIGADIFSVTVEDTGDIMKQRWTITYSRPGEEAVTVWGYSMEAAYDAALSLIEEMQDATK